MITQRVETPERCHHSRHWSDMLILGECMKCHAKLFEKYEPEPTTQPKDKANKRKDIRATRSDR